MSVGKYSSGSQPTVGRLALKASRLEHKLLSEARPTSVSELSITYETVWVAMRDGVRLATDVYRPSVVPAPAIAVRTPYGRRQMEDSLRSIAAAGYVVIAQDCRGTGDSEPDSWDTYIYEREDSYDLVEWVTQQSWYDGFLAGCGGSYLGSTQWAMAMHPRMTAIAPEVAGLVIFPTDMPRYYMLVNAYSRSVGKGADKIPVSFPELERQMTDETLAGGYFNAPLNASLRPQLIERYPELKALSESERRSALWRRFQSSPPVERAELIKVALGLQSVTLESLDDLTTIFGHHTPVGLCINPCARVADLVQSLRAPALIVTGWYDWGLGDTLETWMQIRRHAIPTVRSRSRLLITPSAHNRPGYHEGKESHPELDLTFRTLSVSEKILRTANVRDCILHWYQAVRSGREDDWPRVIFYLMGENRWYWADDWPPPEAWPLDLFLRQANALSCDPPAAESADYYVHDPDNPAPTVGGSIISYVYPPGSVDVSEVQDRSDVLTYTTPPLAADMDVVGPIKLVLFASSSATDTDFAARLSDVFPDGRAIQLQNGVIRARYRNPDGPAELLEPGRVYRFEIHLWATANRFKAGHCVRLDLSSADFPRLDRNANRGGEPGTPLKARQAVFHGGAHASHLILSVLGAPPTFATDISLSAPRVAVMSGDGDV